MLVSLAGSKITGVIKNLSSRYRYSYILLKQLVKTDFKLRYQGSLLGYVWSLLKPLALFVILYVVFTKFLKIGSDIPYYPIYLLLGIVLWNYFSEVTSESVSAIVGKGDLLRKINFPKYVIVMAASFSALINLMLNFIIIAVFMFVAKVPLRVEVLLLPLVIIELFVFSLAVGFFLSAAYVKLRDVSHIWDVVLQGLFYATPILYPISLLPISAAKIVMLNPVAQIIQDARHLLITPETKTIADIYGTQAIRLISFGSVVAVVLVSTWYFKSRSKHFAEEV